MITSVFCKNFKGQSFTQSLKKLNLIVGPNGSGKSARTGALLLTKLGFIPGSSKLNPELFAAFGGDGIQMSVGFATESLSFERIFIRKKGGAVAQKYAISESHNQSKEDFAAYLKKTPAIFDLENFLSLSDQKKIDLIFALFPPEGDPLAITRDIEKKSDQLNKKRSEFVALEGVVERLTKSKAEIKLPAGNLASVKESIAGIKAQLKTARTQLAAAEKERIEQEAKVVAEAEARIKAETEAAEKAHSHPVQYSPVQETYNPLLEAVRQKAEAALKAKTDRAGLIPSSLSAESSITKILETLQGAGCDMCAAVMTAKAELKKHRSDEMRF